MGKFIKWTFILIVTADGLFTWLYHGHNVSYKEMMVQISYKEMMVQIIDFCDPNDAQITNTSSRGIKYEKN